MWARRAEKAADAAEDLTRKEARAQVVELLLQACLPEDLVVPVAHYEQLMTAVFNPLKLKSYESSFCNTLGNEIEGIPNLAILSINAS